MADQMEWRDSKRVKVLISGFQQANKPSSATEHDLAAHPPTRWRRMIIFLMLLLSSVVMIILLIRDDASASSSSSAPAPSSSSSPSPDQTAGICRRGNQTYVSQDEVIVVGSSVALGRDASNNCGYACLLSSALGEAGSTLNVRNLAVSGNTVSLTQAIVDNYFLEHASCPPFSVIVGLSLGNEGLAAIHPADSEAIRACGDNFLSLLQHLTHSITSQSNNRTRVVLGSVYPMDGYLPAHVQELRRVFAAMRTWGGAFDDFTDGGWLADGASSESRVTVIDFFTETEDGYGHWKEGSNTDGTHPNDLGAMLMYQQIDGRLFGL